MPILTVTFFGPGYWLIIHHSSFDERHFVGGLAGFAKYGLDFIATLIRHINPFEGWYWTLEQA